MIFFSTINFSYQYLPEGKAYLEPSRTSTIELFHEFFFLCKIQKKTPVSESLFNKVTGLYLATSVKERTPTQVFSDQFYEIHKTPFLTEHLQATAFAEKYFTNKIVKNPLRKEKKWKQLVRKTTTHAKQKLNHYLHQLFISFYYLKISLFLFSLLPMIY